MARVISEETAKVEDDLKSNIPFPPFNPSSPLQLPEAVKISQEAVLDATDELSVLMTGPLAYISQPPIKNPQTEIAQSILTNPEQFTQFASFLAIKRYKIANSFPVDSEATFEEISNKCGLNESDTRQILRNAMAHYVFVEHRDGVVAHIAASAVLANKPMVGAWLDFKGSEMWPATVRLVNAMERWPASEELNQAGFAIAHNTSRPIYDELAADPRRALSMADGMSFQHSGKGSPGYILKYYDWKCIEDGLVVDVGGSHGSAAIEIA